MNLTPIARPLFPFDVKEISAAALFMNCIPKTLFIDLIFPLLLIEAEDTEYSEV